jgi:hypothetical protein
MQRRHKPQFPNADATIHHIAPQRSAEAVDVLLVNPPAPDGGVWIRSQHRVGRRWRENMIWRQCSLAQFAALLMPDYTVEIVDALATRNHRLWHPRDTPPRADDGSLSQSRLHPAG